MFKILLPLAAAAAAFLFSVGNAKAATSASSQSPAHHQGLRP
ncbi:hypothetical protein [Phenylobacterium sp.]